MRGSGEGRGASPSPDSSSGHSTSHGSRAQTQPPTCTAKSSATRIPWENESRCATLTSWSYTENPGGPTGAHQSSSSVSDLVESPRSPCVDAPGARPSPHGRFPLLDRGNGSHDLDPVGLEGGAGRRNAPEHSVKPSHAERRPRATTPPSPVGPSPWLGTTLVESADLRSLSGSRPVASVPQDTTAHRPSMAYGLNWTHMVLGTTSMIMFVIVSALCYALYLLVQPYSNSITFATLLSMILHPRSRVQPFVSTDVCVKRMKMDAQRWSGRYRCFGIIGAWLSLRHFVAFLVLQLAFVLGLNKIELPDYRQMRLFSSPGTPATNKKRERATTGRSGEPGIHSVGQSRPRPLPPSRAHSRPVILVSMQGGRRVLRYLTVGLLSFVAHMLLSIRHFALLHLCALLMCILLVPIMETRRFVVRMSALWRMAIIAFFVVGLSYNLAADILSISDAVRRTTSAVVERTTHGGGHGRLAPEGSEGIPLNALEPAHVLAESGTPRAVDTLPELLSQHKEGIQEFLLTMIQKHVLSEVADIFNQTNATELASGVFELIAPHFNEQGGLAHGNNSLGISLFQGDSLWGLSSLLQAPYQIASALFRNGTVGNFKQGSASSGTSPSGAHLFFMATAGFASHRMQELDWLGVAKLLMARILSYASKCFAFFIHFGTNVMSFFDNLYALMLFVMVFRYLVHLEHTALYYLIAKLLRVIQPEMGEQHARNIERDITVAVVTLLESFWHLTWFHFTVTFSFFKLWGLPTPFLFGLLSVVVALFPMAPKWLSPCSIALVFTCVFQATEVGILGALHSAQVVSAFLAVALEFSDEWLLRVSKDRRSQSVTGATRSEREQLQPFVVGTALVLGFVVYGMKGIVLGPLTIIVAKVVFDHWDVVLIAPVRRLPDTPQRMEAQLSADQSILKSTTLSP